MAKDLIRYGISALSTKNHTDASNDELLVEQSSGEMFYKREDDGQIVSYNANDYSNRELQDVISASIALNPIHFDINDYMIYHVIDISGTNHMLDTSPIIFDNPYNFPVSKKEAICFFRVHGTNRTNALVSILESRLTGNKNTMRVTICVTDTLSENPSTESNMHIIECNFNKLTAIYLNEFISADSLVGDYQVSIHSIEFINLFDSYNLLTEGEKNAFNEFNMHNNKLEAAKIDFVSFMETTNQILPYADNGRLILHSIIKNSDIEIAALSGDTIIVSENQPNRPCIWAKIIS